MAAPVCTHCHQPLRYGRLARGLCPSCYGRWRHHGDPRYCYAGYADRGPAVPRSPGPEVAPVTARCPACEDVARLPSGYCSRACQISDELGA
jgi:hypothetical protein